MLADIIGATEQHAMALALSASLGLISTVLKISAASEFIGGTIHRERYSVRKYLRIATDLRLAIPEAALLLGGYELFSHLPTTAGRIATIVPYYALHLLGLEY